MTRAAAFAVLTAILSACADGLPPVRLQIGEGAPGPAPNFQGLVAADEPEAALAAADILRIRGNAVDAAVTLALALAVTLPSRAGLGGGGACLVRDAKSRRVEAIDFRGGAALVRGLSALHARYGTLPWAQLVAPAENRARFGVVVSRALALDLSADGARLIADRAAFTVFTTPQRQLVQEGDRVAQPDLAEALAGVRGRAGYGSGTPPQWRAATRRTAAGADVSTYVSDGGDGAGTSFAVADPDGGVVSCGLSMGAAFGTGILTDGVFGATLPSAVSAAIVLNPDTAEPRLSIAASGAAARADRALAVALPPRAELRIPGADGGRVNGWSCPRDIKADGARCVAVSDPGGAGYALALVPAPG